MIEKKKEEESGDLRGGERPGGVTVQLEDRKKRSRRWGVLEVKDERSDRLGQEKRLS